jgi:GNAT superfamily N-acetyltransferase
MIETSQIFSAPAEILAARVEETCLNAWPALQEVHYDGWILRLADGKTRRTNSVNILRNGTKPLDEKITFCENFYREQGLPTHFRILSVANPSLERELASRGYACEDETVTLFKPLENIAPGSASHPVELTNTAPAREWLDARFSIANTPRPDHAKLEKILQALALPAVFAAARGPEGIIDAVAKGAIHNNIVCLNLVATRATARRLGLSKACVLAILDWAIKRGADGACLQVVADNAPAINLYRKLGFSQELYRYHYRTRKGAD